MQPDNHKMNHSRNSERGIALFFAVHAMRTQQNMYWLLILFLFPGLGSAVYFFVIYLPSLRQSRGARAATRAISQLVDPNRAVREAQTHVLIPPIVVAFSR